MSNSHWYTNDIDEIKVTNGNVPPEGFHRGRKPVSEETRMKMSKSQKGHPIYRKTTNKGMKYSDQACKNMSYAKQKFLENNPGWTSSTSFVKGQNAWNKGIPMKDESKKKLSESRKGSRISEETKEKISKKLKGRILSDEHKRKIGKGNIGKKIPDEQRKKISETKKGQHLSIESLKSFRKNSYATKKKNNSFNISKPEDRTYEKLINKFKKEDVIRQYRDENRYPFNCDFYIKSMDLFIECNFLWTHGHHPFDESSIEDIKTLEEWKNKSADSKYYQLAIEVWTKRDVLKRQTMIDNKLNYFVAYKEDDINDFLSRI